MKFQLIFGAVAALAEMTSSTSAFVPQSSIQTLSFTRNTSAKINDTNDQAISSSSNSNKSIILQSSPSEGGEGADIPRKSRLGGNSREPSIQEISIMDDMITKLMTAKPYELPNVVSKAVRVVSSPRFFMRIAERADIATDEVEKEQLSSLATNLVSTIEAVFYSRR